MTSRSVMYGKVSNYMLRAHGHDTVDRRKTASSAKIKFSAFKRDVHESGPVKMSELVSHYVNEQSAAVTAWIDGDSGPESEKLEVSNAAMAVSRKAYEMGVSVGELGTSAEEVCRNIEKASREVSLGQETPEKAVVGMLMESNGPAAAVKILERINAKENSQTISNVIGILNEAERLGLEKNDVAVNRIMEVASTGQKMSADSAIINVVKESNCRTRALEIMTSKIVMNASEKQLEMFRRYLKVYETAGDEHLDRLKTALKKRAA